MEFFLTFCSAGRIKLKINTKNKTKYQRKVVVKEKSTPLIQKKEG